MDNPQIPPPTIAHTWQALEILKVSRIDHGMNSVQDPWLVREINRRDIALTVCPLAYKCGHSGMYEHVIQQMMEKDMRVTLNSDDPAYMNGYIGDVFNAVQAALDLNPTQIYKLCRNAFEAAFLSDSKKREYISKLDEVSREWENECKIPS